MKEKATGFHMPVFFRTEKKILIEPISKIVDHVQEQGVSRSAVALKRGLWRDKRKSAAYIEYVSILRRLTTRLLGVRCIFEIGSKNNQNILSLRGGCKSGF
jgi:hypothetical protein